MCGIFAICQQPGQTPVSLDVAKQLSSLQKHRGPDTRGWYRHEGTGNTLCHERLAIVDLSAVQPLQGSREDCQVIHNGEIYNHESLRLNELADQTLRSHCDSEVIIFLYEKFGAAEMCRRLHGVFALALCAGDQFVAARDPLGVKQMYYGIDGDGRHYFANEMKTLEKECGGVKVASFPPGHYFQSGVGFVRYYEPSWLDWRLARQPVDYAALRACLERATIMRLMSDAPLGVLLSGGLDSSLVSAIAAREMRRRGLGALRSFSIGIAGDSPDLVAAREVAAFIGTTHHEFHFTVQEGLDAIRSLIWHIESYDVTSIRASTPMYFLSRRISELGVKVVLSGEGADEIFGGYLYFHNAPNDAEFQQETIRRVLLLHTSDCLRADKSCMAHGVEVRVPFLDKDFVALSMALDPAEKRPKVQVPGGRAVEKHVLRTAFDDKDEPYLPSTILWRQKEQFSDGIGYAWIDTLMAHAAAQVSDEEFSRAADLFPHNTPHSKEAFYMRRIFAEHFPSDEAAKTVVRWFPRWQTNVDPSGRANAVHEQTTVVDIAKAESVVKSPLGSPLAHREGRHEQLA